MCLFASMFFYAFMCLCLYTLLVLYAFISFLCVSMIVCFYVFMHHTRSYTFNLICIYPYFIYHSFLLVYLYNSYMFVCSMLSCLYTFMAIHAFMFAFSHYYRRSLWKQSSYHRVNVQLFTSYLFNTLLQVILPRFPTYKSNLTF